MLPMPPDASKTQLIAECTMTVQHENGISTAILGMLHPVSNNAAVSASDPPPLSCDIREGGKDATSFMWIPTLKTFGQHSARSTSMCTRAYAQGSERPCG